MQSTTEGVEKLRAAAEALEAAEAAVEELGEGRAERVAAAYEEATSLLARYRSSATGTGDFQAYVEFQDAVAGFVEDLPEELPRREAFEEMAEHLDQRRLHERDFDRAEEILAPAREVLDALRERDDALADYRRARGRVADRRSTLEERIERLERVREFGEADLEAPVERLRGPVEAYDGAVAEAFAAFKREASAREVLGLVATAAWYPLVDFPEPPEDLREYVRTHEAGTETVADLLEYAGYSRSKLGHYVGDPAALKRAVATSRTYLERLDAGPLQVGWPPPPAEDLRWRLREYEAVVRRFAGATAVARARELRRLPTAVDYGRLREAALAREELTEAERRKLADGEVADELAGLRERRDALEAALEEYPER